MILEFSGLVLIQQLINGISRGSVYALIALGYTMVYGIIELINFAHGDVFMLGTFTAISFVGLFGINDQNPSLKDPVMVIVVLILTFIVTMAVMGTLGVVIERVAYRPLRNAPRLAPLISAIGVSLVLQNVGILWKGVNFVSFPQFYFFTSSVHLGPAGSGVDIKAVNILVIVLAVILT